MLEEDLASALEDLENNQQVLAGMGKELEEWRWAGAAVIEYVAPAPTEGEEMVDDERPLLDRLHAAPNAMRVMETSSARECAMRAL